MPATETGEPAAPSLGGTLRVAFQGLHTSLREIRQGCESFRAPTDLLVRLKEAARAVAAPRTPKPPADTMEALQRWKSALSSGMTETLSRRDLRQLTWEPEAVFDARFQGVLERCWAGMPLSSRTMQALVRSFHKGWTPACEGERTAKWLRLLLGGDVRESEAIRKWKRDSAVVLGPGGRDALALKILAEDRPVAEVATRWGIDDHTPYFEAAVSQRAVPWAIDPQYRGPGLEKLFSRLLPWARKVVSEARFKELVSTVILDDRFANEGPDLVLLKAYVLGAEGLGDPRLPANRARWTGVSDQARTRVLHWLTKADIVMFFETILPDSMDKHGRKPFWLRYHDSILTSRPLLTFADRFRVGLHFRGREDELQHLGTVYKQASSAFFLLFPDVLIVEFAVAGCAYFYTGENRRKLEREMWRSAPFSTAELKNMDGSREAIPHTQGWENRMASALARFGVRARSRNLYY